MIDSPKNTFDFIPANAFSYEELTEVYNKTRVDYIVPMPMNAAKLREYVESYDIDMSASAVAVDGNEVLGLSMLGVRDDRAWITRLGVIRSNRKRGTGEALVNYLIDQARERDISRIFIEVIENNIPAYSLFQKKGFKDTRDLLVLRRPPVDMPLLDPTFEVQIHGYNETLALLNKRQSIPSWIDETASLINAGNLAALSVTLPNGAHGWLVYQNTVFQLGRLVIQTEVGDPLQIGRALLQTLHSKHPVQDTKTENLPADDPHWLAFKEMNYFVTFRRNEMVFNLKP
jgi:ribosomal protein S18 acetylase RimI-like enzyme